MGMVASEASGQGIPCVYALFPNKKELTYQKMFTAINEKLEANVSPTTILTDFEQAVFNAVARVFPDAVQRGCGFHRNAAIFSQVQAKGLQSFFHNNRKFQELIYKCYALCYVPAHLIHVVYEDVIVPAVTEGHATEQDWEEFLVKIEEFGVYMTSTWVKKRGGRAALFPPHKGKDRGVAKGLSPPPPSVIFLGGGAPDFAGFFPFKP